MATKHIHSNITFDSNTRLEKKIIFALREYMFTTSNLVSKFCECPTKIDFIGTYTNFQLFVQQTIDS